MAKRTDKMNPKREELVEIASRLFYAQGFGATGIKQIIEEADIAKGTFYSHFESKEELGLAWLRARHTIWQAWLEEKFRDKKSSAGKILAAFAFLEEWLQEADFRGCAFINTMAEIPDGENPMREEVANHKLQLRETFEDLALEHFIELGQPRAAARQKGTLIYLLFEGAIVESQLFQDVWPIQTARKGVKSLLTPPTNP